VRAIGYIHVPKTGGLSVRMSINALKSQQVKYLGHRPNCENFEREYITVAVLRNPYDIFLSGYRFYRSMYVDNLPGYSIQDHIDKITIKGFDGYRNKWFKYKQPQHLIMFESLQHDWIELLRMYDIPHDNQLPHLHNTMCDKSLESVPTTCESEQIKSIVANDVKYYNKLSNDYIHKKGSTT